MSQYKEMSLVYDQLTQDQPYHLWFDIVQYYAHNHLDILDIGCGTGTLTCMLNELGNINGMDISSDMLAIASQKTNQINWLEGDMTRFELDHQFDIITIFCDSLNYLPTIEDVEKTFIHVYSHLKEGGLLIFDVHTVEKMNTLFNNQSYIDENDGLYLGWDAIRGEEPLSVYHQMSFFIEHDNGLYQRFDEEHYQRTFEKSVYLKLLEQCNFKIIKTFTDFDMNSDNEQADRLFFVAEK
ncbi:class I SAM-dependent DNA methyltransferase [Staphylococcus warneri]|uniref:class I SAM-dependent DNA methyltransferase n=1 Tax=Staphylococcus warneri TaxID=1292 RepID=UPI001F479256|nr:class I SAM-dependent methyltransferase [Staphylococcus warneri]MCF7594268.1 class I SAM-dependent methyltransferase [Staphylococcus warneri]